MEWVETTGKTIEEATEQALDRLGVDVDEVDIEVLEEPKNGLFGKTRGSPRVSGRAPPLSSSPPFSSCTSTTTPAVSRAAR